LRELENFFEKRIDPSSFSAIQIGIASPEKIRSWSYGEVKKSETINYRTFKPEKDGLFCAKIFGPVRDYECNCGKYKRMKHRGIVCEKCGVEVIQSKVRRERLGHINLATPVAHIWFLKSLPSRIGCILDITLKSLEKVLYCESYIVIEPGETDLQECEILSTEKYQAKLKEFGNTFKVGIGAEAIRTLLMKVDIDSLSSLLRVQIKEAVSEAIKKKYIRRLKVIEAIKGSGNMPEWLMLDVIPVLPPDLRPLVPLDGGRFATSDLNDLYRRVINRNNRLNRLIELNAPGIIIRNEKRMLQEAVDALFDNGRRGKTFTGPNKRPLRSLSDMLKGKQGRFRQNLLGKRVDYSGRSVIVVGPELRLHQCGLPKKMAIELFKPFIYNKLEEDGYVSTIKSAKKMVEKEYPEVWDVLEEVTKEHPVMVNRAPTLHRLGIQAFEPVLIEGKAIQLHPLVCAAFNADFDGDQMAVHVPLSIEAQMEARVLMMSTNNILSPAYGKPIILPSQDMVLGIYYMTREKEGAKGTGKSFFSIEEVRCAYDHDQVELQSKILVRIDDKMVKTSVGRILVKEIVPEEIPFEEINKVMTKKDIADLIDHSYRRCGKKKTILLADNLRSIGYEYATKAGISISVDDMYIPETKAEMVSDANKQIKEIQEQYSEGLITDGERYNKVIDIWAETTENIASEMFLNISTDVFKDEKGKNIEGKSFNSIFMMSDSGARGSAQQIRQLAGMRGLMARPSGEIIESPITANFREGLTVLQYFISTHGARKGLADTALKTANSGYLTRRLIDVAQDSTIQMINCGALDGVEISALIESGEVIQSLGERILGRVAVDDVEDPLTGEILVKMDELIDEDKVRKIEHAGIEKLHIRSVLSCRSRYGICAHCYGRDLATGNLVNIGEAIGVIAAQSIGEPGTQLTMRTFHVGGTASKRVEQSSLENRFQGAVKYKDLQTVTNREGLEVVMNRISEIVIVDDSGREKERYPIVYGARLFIKDGTKVKPNTVLAEWDPYNKLVLSDSKGKVVYGDLFEGISFEEKTDDVTGLSSIVVIPCKDAELKPRVSIVDDKKNIIKNQITGRESKYLLPIGSMVVSGDQEEIFPGDIIAKIPRELSRTKDITGGLPRVAELFEARKPKDCAVISEIDGEVTFGEDVKGKRRVIVSPMVGKAKEYLIPRGKHISVNDGEKIKAGEALMDGSINPHDILSILGEEALSAYLVNEIQEVYRLQAVKINDKHIEVIVRNMLKKIKIKDPGDSEFLTDEQVDKWVFEEVNNKLHKEGSRLAVGEPLLLGITKAALNTHGFISAASFQETTKVLTEASLSGKVDSLIGLKENVIMGRLIPAGTGAKQYQTNISEIIPPSDELQ